MIEPRQSTTVPKTSKINARIWRGAEGMANSNRPLRRLLLKLDGSGHRDKDARGSRL
jgi:hypothetical protein